MLSSWLATVGQTVEGFDPKDKHQSQTEKYPVAKVLPCKEVAGNQQGIIGIKKGQENQKKEPEVGRYQQRKQQGRVLPSRHEKHGQAEEDQPAEDME